MTTTVRIDFDEAGVLAAVKRGNAVALRRAGAYVRTTVRHGVVKSAKSSAPGATPHTRRGLLKRSILFGVDSTRQSVVIGPARSIIGISMTAHEFGGLYRRRNYPKRPFMGPALLKTAPQLPKLWEDSLKP